MVPCLSSRTSEPFCRVCQEKLNKKEFISLSICRISIWKQRGENKNGKTTNTKSQSEFWKDETALT